MSADSGRAVMAVVDGVFRQPTTVVGMALGECRITSRGGNTIDHRTWVRASVFDPVQEEHHQTISLARQHGLGPLAVLAHDGGVGSDDRGGITRGNPGHACDDVVVASTRTGRRICPWSTNPRLSRQRARRPSASANARHVSGSEHALRTPSCNGGVGGTGWWRDQSYLVWCDGKGHTDHA